MCLCDFSVIFSFGQRFDAVSVYLWNFAGEFCWLFQLFVNFRWFGRIWVIFRCTFDAFSKCLWDFSHANVSWKFLISSNFPGLRYRIFRKMNVFSSFLGVSLRFFRDFQFWTAFWRSLGVSLEFRWWILLTFSTFCWFSMIWTDLTYFLMHFWRVLAMRLGFFALNFRDFSLKFRISSIFSSRIWYCFGRF